MIRRGEIRCAAVAAAAVAIAAILLAGACSDGPGEPGANLDPETGLAFVGDLDTTLYLQQIRWWGSDQDGAVVGFEYRWTAAVPTPGLDSNWVFTTDVFDTFALPAPAGYAAYTFHVRSLDDRGGLDPTPAEQTYPFSNSAPRCSLLVVNDIYYPDTLFPSLTLKWLARDPDGDETLDRFLIWTGENPQNPVVVEDGAARSAPLGPEDLGSGWQTVFIQAIDSGQRASAPDSFTAFFLPAPGRILLVDDLPDEQLAAGGSPDPAIGVRYADYFYFTNLDTFYTQGRGQEFSRIDLQITPLETREQVRRLFEEYDRVVWYDTISDSLPSKALQAAGEFLPDWLGEGGRMLLVSTYAIGTNVIRFNPAQNRGDTIPEALFPNMDDRFRRVTLGIERIVRNRQTLQSTYPIYGNEGLGLDSLRQRGGFVNTSMDLFELRSGATPLYRILAGTELSSGDTLAADASVGVMNDTGAGRMMLIGFPLSRMREHDVHDGEFRKLLGLLEGD